MSSSPPPKLPAKTAAKRRAAIRRRNKDLVRQMLAIFFVAIFVLGTATTAFVFQQKTNTAQNQQVPVATAAPTEASANVIQTLIQQGDQAAGKQDWNSAVSFYSAALGQNAGNATLYFKLGKAYIGKQDYAKGVENLQKAIDLNPSAAFAAEARTLIDQNKGKALSGGAGGAITSTLPITATAPITK